MQAEMRMYIPQLLRLRNAFVPFLCRSPFGGKLTSLALLFRSECVMYDYGAASKFKKGGLGGLVTGRGARSRYRLIIRRRRCSVLTRPSLNVSTTSFRLDYELLMKPPLDAIRLLGPGLADSHAP